MVATAAHSGSTGSPGRGFSNRLPRLVRILVKWFGVYLMADDRIVATGGEDRTIRLWENSPTRKSAPYLSKGTPILLFPVCASAVTASWFSVWKQGRDGAAME